MNRLPRSFYARPTPVVARALLGQRLVRVLGGRRLAGRIVEAEAYTGSDDLASHARNGRTSRNAPMFDGPPGGVYVYFIYGVHWMFNVVAHQAPPGAVLVRALAPLEGLDAMRARRGGRPERLLTNGPARLTQALGIDQAFNGVDLVTHPHILIEAGPPPPNQIIACGPRVGVSGDELARTRPWRFWVRDDPFVSR
jgi:DNA-3-methyladenine glycosylase